MSNGKARVLLWSPVVVVALLPLYPPSGSLGGFKGPPLDLVFSLAALGYFLFTGTLAAFAGMQAIERHPGRLRMAAGAGALVVSSAAAPMALLPLLSLFLGTHRQFSPLPFLVAVCFLAVPGALLGLLGGWMAVRQDRVCHAT